MTATTVTDGTIRAAPRHLTAESGTARCATLLSRWTTRRRRRRYLAEKLRHDARDRCDRYLDGVHDTHQRQALAAFVQR